MNVRSGRNRPEKWPRMIAEIPESAPGAFRRPVSQYFEVHPVNPQPRLIRRAADIVREGGVIAYPTDSCYALGCHIGDKDALERVRRIRQADRNHHFTLVCRDLSEIGRYAQVDTWQFRLLKACTPGRLHVLAAGHARNAAPPAARAAPDHRHPRARSSSAAGAAGGAGRAADELDADAARGRRAADRWAGDPRPPGAPDRRRAGRRQLRRRADHGGRPGRVARRSSCGRARATSPGFAGGIRARG